MEETQKWMSDEGHFRQTLDHMLEGIQIHDFDWRYTYVNDALVRQSTYTKEELIGYTLMEKYPGIEQSPLFQVLEKCMTERVHEHFETEFHFPNGTMAYFELSIQPVPQGLFILSINITERKKAQKSLRQAKSNYREIFENANDAIYVLDITSGKLLEVNEKAAEITGYPKEELLNRDLSDLMTDHPSYLPQKYKVYLQRAAAGIPQYFEWLGKKKDGTYTWVEVTLKKVTLGGEERMLAFWAEMNHRKENEENIRKLNEELELKVLERTAQLHNHIQRLKESEERFQKAFHSSAAGMAITRLSDSVFLDVNDTFVQMVGRSKKDIIGHTSKELGMIVDIENRDNVWRQIQKEGYAKHFEMSILHKSGKVIHVLSSVETILLQNERYAINIIFDITERKLAEELVKKSDALFSSLFEFNPASFAISRISDGKIVNVNESFLRLFGFSSKQEVIGKTSAELNILDKPVEKRRIHEMVEKLQTKERVQNMEVPMYTQQGEMKWTSTSVIMVEIDNEPCILAVSLDITKRKKTEEELHAVNRELEAFTYSVSHDLRAPLRSISGYAQILGEDYGNKLDDEGIRVIGVIQKNAVKMGRLIDDLLGFSRLGRKEIVKADIDMNKLTEAVKQELIRSTPHEATIQVSTLHTVKADYTLLYQVMFNLVANAVKYSAKKEFPHVGIASEKKDGEVVFSIKDNGAGFDMQYQNKLFGVFQRLHSQEEFEGTGVGLAIVQRILTKHGGKVWAEGKVGEGATFYFTLS